MLISVGGIWLTVVTSVSILLKWSQDLLNRKCSQNGVTFSLEGALWGFRERGFTHMKLLQFQSDESTRVPFPSSQWNGAYIGHKEKEGSFTKDIVWEVLTENWNKETVKNYCSFSELWFRFHKNVDRGRSNSSVLRRRASVTVKSSLSVFAPEASNLQLLPAFSAR